MQSDTACRRTSGKINGRCCTTPHRTTHIAYVYTHTHTIQATRTQPIVSACPLSCTIVPKASLHHFAAATLHVPVDGTPPPRRRAWPAWSAETPAAPPRRGRQSARPRALRTRETHRFWFDFLLCLKPFRIYPDRLGTNTRKLQKGGVFFAAHHPAASHPPRSRRTKRCRQYRRALHGTTHEGLKQA